jgi:hypothetical protein
VSVGGAYTADFDRAYLVGAGLRDGRLSSSLGGSGKGLHSLLGDAVSLALHDGVIFFSLPPTL